MAVENIAVWSIPPDWRNGMSEYLTWLTSVLQSPLGIEQRFSLRLSPRQSYEVGYTLTGPNRAYLDLLTLRSSGSPVYLPLWYEPEKLQSAIPVGTTALAISTANSEFKSCQFVFLGGRSPFEYEVVEIASVAASSITLTTGTVYAWPAGSLVYPAKKCRVQVQPAVTRFTDRVTQVQARFESLEPNKSAAVNPLGLFGSQYVLEDEPNESDLDVNYSRLMFEVDASTGIPELYDVSGFAAQKFSWFAKGRAQLARLRGVLYALQGRRTPIWVPTFSADLDLVGAVAIGATTFDVKRCGFTDANGPFPNREYIVVRLRDGRRLYNKITASVILGDGSQERLSVSTAFDTAFDPNSVKRISFLALSRLDQDEVEIVHHTDSKGVSTATTVFRSATAYPGVDLAQNFEVPVAANLLGPACLALMQWNVTPTNYPITGNTPQTDTHGNVYLLDANTVYVYSPSGVLLNSMTHLQFQDKIAAKYGLTLQNVPLTVNLWIQTVVESRYLLVSTMAEITGGNDSTDTPHWTGVFEAMADGSLTLLGALWYTASSNTAPRFLNAGKIDTPIMAFTFDSLGAHYANIQVLPSVQDFIGGIYEAGYGAGYYPFEIPYAVFRPIGGSDNFADYFYKNSSTNANYNGGFYLPDSSGGWNLYFYISKAYMVAPGGNVEITNILAPAYPGGCIVKVPLGNVNFATIAATTPVATAVYTVDNGNWREADGTPAIPFDEEFTYISSGAPGGGDTYQMEPGWITKRPNGKYWITFFMPGVDDKINIDTSRMWMILRVFEYDPNTEVATQIAKITCVLHTTETGDNRLAWYLKTPISDDGLIATIHAHRAWYKTNFGTFPLPG